MGQKKHLAYHLYIELNEIKPKIWRRIKLDPNIYLDDFHRIVQTTMGWTNSHLHVFNDGDQQYAPAEFEVDNAIDSREFRLFDILTEDNPALYYEYDFGDGWEHKIILDEVKILDKPYGKPVCIDGARQCPPEDVGGVHGYYELLEAMKEPSSFDYKDFVRWLGKPFDPDQFDADKISKLLKRKDFGCEWIE